MRTDKEGDDVTSFSASSHSRREGCGSTLESVLKCLQFQGYQHTVVMQTKGRTTTKVLCLMRKFALCKRGPNVETSLDKAKHATLANFKPVPMALPGLPG